MLDVKLLREDLARVKERLAYRGGMFSFDAWSEQDRSVRCLTVQIEALQHRRNKVSETIARMKRTGGDIGALLNEMRQVADEITQYEAKRVQTQQQVASFLSTLPNLPYDSVPVGRDELENKEVRRWGSIETAVETPKPHWEVAEALGILDFKRGAKIAGARFTLYMGAGARLERALINLMLDVHVGGHGYQEVLPPFMVNRESLFGTGQLPKFEEDLFFIKDDDYFLIPTGEVPLTNIHRGEILTEEQLPLKYVAYTPCFRREAGSYGKDVRGLIRQHQFNKVELVRLETPERSAEGLETLVQDAGAVLERLALPYRVMALCTGDLGFSAAKGYDLEVWLPSQRVYREISSCSHFDTFQARRANIRYRSASGKLSFVHTLNGSGLAVGRTVAAILENYQQSDGSVLIPEVLRPYMGGIERIM